MENDLPVVVSLGTPLMDESVRSVFPAQTSLGDCIRQVSETEPTTARERRVVQQIRREVSGSRFGIFVIFQGKSESAQPSELLADVAVVRELRTAGRVEKVLVAQIELQAYAPVGHDVESRA